MKDFVVMGYEFENEKAYLAAKQEMEDILQLKIDYDVKTYNGYLEFYNSILDNKLNKTPIGIEYVRNMQRELLKNTKDKSNRLHGFTHAKRALKNAEKEFSLNPIERDIIIRHMFPLNIKPPKYRESIIVCIADKISATIETLFLRKEY